jgi:hypothetical protein
METKYSTAKLSTDLQMIADALEPLRGMIIADGSIEDGTDTSISVSLIIDGLRENAEKVAQIEESLNKAYKYIALALRDIEAAQISLAKDTLLEALQNGIWKRQPVG